MASLHFLANPARFRRFSASVLPLLSVVTALALAYGLYLALVEARQTFRVQMAEYLRDQAAGSPRKLSLPALSHERALGLYRAILAEDPDFQHRDAAR